MPSRKSSTTAPAAGPAGTGLKVTSRPESFWRGGLQFTREPRVLPLAELTPEQADAIRAEGDGGQLVVEEVAIEAPKG
jgi:hypothetical protein